MDISGSTILITGGGSGIGRGLAAAFHAGGAKVIISGRRAAALAEVADAHPGMGTAEVDMADGASVAELARRIALDHPALDVLVNNAGIMVPESVAEVGPVDAVAERTIATNLLGPILLTTALLPTLRARPRAAIINTSSGLAFVPLAAFPTYSASKAAIHSYTQSLRAQLRGSAIDVIELIPPYVQTTLTGEAQAGDPAAMPLDDFIAEAMAILERTPTPVEIAVTRVEFFTRAQAEQRYDVAFEALNSH